MKKWVTGVLVLTGLVSAATMMNANMISPKTDAEGHVLTKQWQAFHKAANADRPKEMASVLEKIKADATKKHYAEDFYDAGREWVYVTQRRNWKESSAARETFRKEVVAFDEPIVTFTWMQEFDNARPLSLFRYARDNGARLRAGRHPHFYSNLGAMDGNLVSFLTDDEEYALWMALMGRSFNGKEPEKDEVYAALAAREAGVYPAGAYLEYVAATHCNGNDRTEALKAVDARYDGKAVALYAKQALLRERFSELQRQKASEEAYKAFAAECEAVEKTRKAFKGDEKTIADACTGVRDILDDLNGTSVSFASKDRRIDVIFKNLAQAEIQFCTSVEGEPDKVLWTRKVVNDKHRFYLEDTTSFQLPMMDDGDYILRCTWAKDRTALHRFSQYRLSLATRAEAGGIAAYAADYLTGEPVEDAVLVLYKGGKEQFADSIRFNGFTRIPDRFRKELSASGSRELSCRRKDADGFFLRSRPVSLWSDTAPRIENPAPSGTRCNIYKDRGAYNPGNTLQYKIVVFEGNLFDDNRTVPAGRKFTATLTDSEGNKLDTEVLTTGEFGSAAGSFVLPTGLRNGWFSLTIRKEGATQALATDHFRVDEFVLPTFELSFDRRDSLYFQGDTVPVSGRVKSYSGHSLQGARLRLEVSRWGSVILPGQEVPIAADGSFRTEFVAGSTGYYHIGATVTDGTGETQEFNSGVYVIDAVQLLVTPDETATGSVELAGGKGTARKKFAGESADIITRPALNLLFEVKNTDGQPVPGIDVGYILSDDRGRTLRQGTVRSGERMVFDLPASGLYILKTEVRLQNGSGKDIRAERTDRYLLVRPDDKVLDAPVHRFVQVVADEVAEGETFGLRFGSADGPVWAVYTLYGNGGEILDTRLVHLEGRRGQEGSLVPLTCRWEAGWPEAVRMSLFWFRDGRQEAYDHEFRRRSERLSLPLQFSALTDAAYPETEYRVTLRTEPGVEALAAVYDKSLDAVAGNDWPVVRLRTYRTASMDVNATCGSVGGDAYWRPYYDLEDGMVLMKTATRSAVANAPVMMAVVEEAGAAPEGVAADSAEPESVAVRDRFEEALAFEPFLRSDGKGELSFSFRTSGKLSTYYVAVYAHDKSMRNAYVRGETVVSLPVKVAVTPPRLLYRGDVLQLSANVSSTADKPVSGTLYLYAYDGADPATARQVSVQRISLKVPAGSSLAKTFTLRVPAVDTLGLKTVFVAKEFSDALFQTVPVAEPVQSLTESHSAVLLAGMDEAALRRDLRSRFVNVSAGQAEESVITVVDMVRDAIPGHVEPNGDDVLSLTEAWYTRRLAAALKERYPALALPEDTDSDALLGRILACRNADGGFGWFEGMHSSPVVTAVVLDRFASLRERGFDVPDLTETVKWLDGKQFTDQLPLWCGGVTDAQYMFIRARYASVPFEFKASGDRKTFDKRVDDFKRYAQDYLVPSEADGRGLTGNILAKARRVATLRSLLATGEGTALAKAWGVRWGTEKKMRSSLDADIQSLLEYAVAHRDGGWYYPNAVLPFRGLLESEAYAHALLADLLTAWAADKGLAPHEAVTPSDDKAAVPDPHTVADGIRIWLMLQKETQQWDTDPAYVDAITAVLDGSDAVLGTKVLVLKADYTLPFEKIRAAGNGFTIERRFYREQLVPVEDEYRSGSEARTVARLEEIRPGTPVSVGDKIVASYRIWNQENRSFIRIVAPREGALMPVEQLSGRMGWTVRPLGGAHFGWTFSPQGYRNVKADRTEYYYDSFPEENSELTETFFVTQAGSFTAPVLTVESLYAPHYRANAAYPGILTAK